MAGQRGFFDTDERLRWLSAAGDPLERLASVVDFELFRPELDAALGRERPRQGRPAALRRGADVPHPGAADALHAVRRPDRVPAARPALVHALRRAGAARRGPRRQDDLAVPRAAGPRRGVRAAVRAVRRGAGRARLPGHGRPDRRRHHRRGAPPAADAGREGRREGRRHRPRTGRRPAPGRSTATAAGR